MFNIGFTELLMIAALALIFIGPKQLPEVARAVGKFLNELRRASDEAMQVFKETQTRSEDFIKKTHEQLNRPFEDLDKKILAEKSDDKTIAKPDESKGDKS
jgi:Tat protein translocase TatB subunit